MAVIAGEQATVLVTVMVNVTVFPASPAAAVYTGAVVVPPEVIEPAPLWVHAIVPLVDDELMVAVPFEQIVWLPPALAVGNAFTITV